MRAGIREEDKGHDFFLSSVPPPLFFVSFRESARCGMDGGVLGAGFRGIGVERVYRIMMVTDREGPAVVAGALEVERNGRLYVLLVGTIMSPGLLTRRTWANNSAKRSL